MDIPGFVLYGAPRTKKNHSRIIHIPKAGARKCHACGHRPGFPKLLPSEAHEAWFDKAMQQLPGLLLALRRRGVNLPIAGMVNIEALFYRDKLTGDANGYYQALADFLQAAGFITNDAQVESWDGSRRLKDAANPRIEVYITVLTGESEQQEIALEATTT